MRNLRRALFAAFVILLILVVLAFVLENQQLVSLFFLGWVGPKLPVSLVMVVSLLLGMVIGPIIGWFLRRTSGSRKHLV